jgi:uncharacterized protein (UPF0332 family)
MNDEATLFLEKAEESLAGAESEIANGRYNNAANRAYYACFLAAVSALLQAGIRPRSSGGQWSHEFVWGQFVGELINRRKIYPSDLRDTFERVHRLREVADYRADRVTRVQASRVVGRANSLIEAVMVGGGNNERRSLK